MLRTIPAVSVTQTHTLTLLHTSDAIHAHQDADIIFFILKCAIRTTSWLLSHTLTMPLPQAYARIYSHFSCTHRWEDKIANRKLVVADSVMGLALDVQDGTFNVQQQTRLVIPVRRLTDQEKAGFRGDPTVVVDNKAPSSAARGPSEQAGTWMQTQAAAAAASITASTAYSSSSSADSASMYAPQQQLGASGGNLVPDNNAHSRFADAGGSHGFMDTHSRYADKQTHERLDMRGGMGSDSQFHASASGEDDVSDNMVLADANEIHRLKEVRMCLFLTCIRK